MNKIILVFFICIMILGCRQNTPVANNFTLSKLEKEIPTFADPDQFIGNYKAKAMILGVFHFESPDLDDYKPKYPFDILSKQRQNELDDLLEKIAAYKPTKILIEQNRIQRDSIINVRYQSFLRDSFLIHTRSNEIFQIGFKLAKKMGHQKIFSSDADAEDWFGVDLDWDNFDDVAYQKSRGQYEKMNRYNYSRFYEWTDSLKTKQSLTQHLHTINQPAICLKDHQAYLTTITEGAGDNYLGADSVTKWYRRNLRIFANAYDITDFDKEDRLLLIYGSGHVWQLRSFFKDSPDFDYAEVNEYLKE